ncbi:Uncharacterised protein [Klebsiella michiganensis]|nr:Uncharacterised protein [Klebsiella michiganensis]
MAKCWHVREPRSRDVCETLTSESQRRRGVLSFRVIFWRPHEPGGQFYEARAELSRRQQAESDLNAQALSYYKTAEVRSADEAAPPDTATHVRNSDQRRTQSESETGDIDAKAAEESLTTAPDMMITTLDDEGNPQSRPARELLDEANRENEQAIQDSGLFDVAVACFLRG